MNAETLTIRRATAADVDFIREVAVLVLSMFGDYRDVVPRWLFHEGVLVHVGEHEGRRVGFTMLGFYPTEKSDFIADLLAIAVVPDAQRCGIGRRLLEHVVTQTGIARRRLAVSRIRLSVAESNRRAQKLFERFDFRFVDGDHGYYEKGQRALQMVRVL